MEDGDKQSTESMDESPGVRHAHHRGSLHRAYQHFGVRWEHWPGQHSVAVAWDLDTDVSIYADEKEQDLRRESIPRPILPPRDMLCGPVGIFG